MRILRALSSRRSNVLTATRLALPRALVVIGVLVVVCVPVRAMCALTRRDSSRRIATTARCAATFHAHPTRTALVAEGVRMPVRAMRFQPVVKDCASLGHHVRDVLHVGAEKEVRGVHARRVVAAVQDVEAIRYRTTDVQFPRYAMRDASPSALSARPDSAVTLSVGCGRPQPARVGLVHLRREPRGQRATDADALARLPFAGQRRIKNNERIGCHLAQKFNAFSAAAPMVSLEVRSANVI